MLLREVVLELSSAKTVQPAAGACHYFKVDSIDDSVAELKGRGLRFEDDPHLVAKMPDHELWMTFFKDPTVICLR